MSYVVDEPMGLVQQTTCALGLIPLDGTGELGGLLGWLITDDVFIGLMRSWALFGSTNLVSRSM